MERRKIRIGSRESKLAVIQSQMVMDLIHQYHPEIELELVTMKTTGDIILDKTLDKIGGKGLFVKELDKALLEGKIDLSVHSLKDMPMEVPEEIPLIGFSKRENPSDVLVLPEGVKELDPAKPIGSSSRRRNLQLSTLYPGHETKSVRGNVLTRLSKLDSGEYSALVLAYAGLERLGLSGRISRAFSPQEMVPSAGQGILAIQGRAGENYDFLDCVRDKDAESEALAERAFVRYLDGGCSSPIGAFAQASDSKITIRGLYYDEESGEYCIEETSGERKDGIRLAEALAKRLKEEGARCKRK
ncbi:hydroxymethylbilane synthase [Sinanaerobacter sp. ZZT-01]|uniref:hydroxymethylbilane synthase n=1 Tax=Sinanaerobacter sp. ZZT-01 TaxID=3111540 RepID=UPI002D79B9E2|nr:hydroxymethylbilane synthase [Sinanaerobacter sp. ZZT-01]WRR94667.1 hydroxymethylbilane synthase [Sinanaerobacter sp. ZZT-01]